MAKRMLVSKVAGVTYPDPRSGEDRQAIISKLTGKEPCRLQPEPDNPHDKNAIAVEIATPNGIKHCGYIPRDIAAQVAPHLEGESLMVKIREITGGFETWDGGTASYGLLLEIELPDTAEVK